MTNRAEQISIENLFCLAFRGGEAWQEQYEAIELACCQSDIAGLPSNDIQTMRNELVIHVLVRGLPLVTACFLFGCGSSGPDLGKVQGTVSLRGVPVKEGSIQFWPANGRPARGAIGSDGTYQLTTFSKNDGAYVSQHRVTIKSTTLTDPGPELESQQAEIEHFRKKNIKPIRASRVVWIIPRKYSERETSSLTATVKSGANRINFDIGAESQ